MDTIKLLNNVGDNYIRIPLNLDFKNNGYSDLITRIAEEEKQKNVNLIVDSEKMRFYPAKYETSAIVSGVNLEFYFKNNLTSSYDTNFINAGFSENDINNSRNRLTKSFFRLDFYDSDNENTRNFLFSEQLYVGLKKTPSFDLTHIYWVKGDPNFINDNSYRELFFTVTFFNAKNGLTTRFINTNAAIDITLNNYSNNKDIRTTKIRVLNPYIDQPLVGSKNNIFYIEPINGNTDIKIKFTELNLV
jgi:hypothetical protein